LQYIQAVIDFLMHNSGSKADSLKKEKSYIIPVFEKVFTFFLEKGILNILKVLRLNNS